jgi:hypothetical protein
MRHLLQEVVSDYRLPERNGLVMILAVNENSFDCLLH